MTAVRDQVSACGGRLAMRRGRGLLADPAAGTAAGAASFDFLSPGDRPLPQLRREVEELEAQLAAAPPAAEEADEEAGPPQGQAAMPGLEALVGAKSSDRQRRALTEKACATGAGLFGATPSSVRVRPRGDGLVEYSFDTVVSPSASPRGPVPRGASAWALAFKLQVRPAAPPGAVPRIETMALQCPGAAMWPELAAALDRAQVRRAGRHCPGAVDRRPHPASMQRLRDPGLATSTLRSYAAQHAEVRSRRGRRLALPRPPSHSRSAPPSHSAPACSCGWSRDSAQHWPRTRRGEPPTRPRWSPAAAVDGAAVRPSPCSCTGRWQSTIWAGRHLQCLSTPAPPWQVRAAA